MKGINEYSITDSDDILREQCYNFSTTGHLQLWHDASSLNNHGYILFTVDALYDPAYTFPIWNMNRYPGKKSMLSEIEIPQLYIVGRCRSNDEQLAVVTRVESLQELGKGTESKCIIIKMGCVVFMATPHLLNLMQDNKKVVVITFVQHVGFMHPNVTTSHTYTIYTHSSTNKDLKK